MAWQGHEQPCLQPFSFWKNSDTIPLWTHEKRDLQGAWHVQGGSGGSDWGVGKTTAEQGGHKLRSLG